MPRSCATLIGAFLACWFKGILSTLSARKPTMLVLSQRASLALTHTASSMNYETPFGGYLNHYKSVLGEHQIPLPFSEDAGA